MTKTYKNKTSACFKSQNENEKLNARSRQKAIELRVVPEIRRRTKRAKIKKHNDAQTNTAKIRAK